MLLGKGAFVAWHDIAAGREADYDRWHSQEHMLERVGIDGFRRGRRYVATGDGPRYLVMYEVADIGVLNSAAYLERLNNPSAWTREIMPSVQGMNRTLCAVEASAGSGIGHALLCLRLAPREDSPREDSVGPLKSRLRAETARLADIPGLVAAHFLIADKAASGSPTRESQLRGAPDAIADWVLLVEGYSTTSLRALGDGALSPETLERDGAETGVTAHHYQLAHLVSREDTTASES